MTVKVSHAKANEYGRTTGGQAGDQLAGQSLTPYSGPLEVVEEDWYNKGDNPWTYVLRPPSQNFADRLAYFAKQIVANDNVGYAQDRRNTLLDALNANNWSVGTLPPCDCDCSSFVRVCCIYAGADPGNFYTANELNALTNIGFTAINDPAYTSSPNLLQVGDVLLRNGHTCVVTYAQTNPPYFVWMKWCFYESGRPYNSPESLSMWGGVNPTNSGYGQFGFRYEYSLVPFMQFCVDHSPTIYDEFNPYIALGAGNPALVNNTALHNIFIDLAYNYTDDFAWCQNQYAKMDYLDRVMPIAQQSGVQNLDNPFIRGMLFSFAIRNGIQGSATMSAISAMSASSDVETQINGGYVAFRAYYPNELSRYVAEMNDCLNDFHDGDNNVYDLNGDEPYVPPEPTPKKRKGMPIWMMIRYMR